MYGKDYVNFKIEKKKTTLILYMDNPPQNSIDETFFLELQEIIELANSDPDVISVIITTALEKIFTVGANLKELLQKYGSKRKMKNGWHHLDVGHMTLEMIENSPKPFIIAYKGLSYGGGIELGCACDIRIASEDVKFAMPETRISFIPGWGGSTRLPRLIGCGRAKKLIFTGEPINAIKALEMGFIDEIAPKGKALECALKIAENIAEGCPTSTALAKKTINEGMRLNLEEAIEREKIYFMESIFSLEWTEGVVGFLNKRKPNFKRIGKEEKEALANIINILNNEKKSDN
ncbi:MAG: enoyl-CoA hydratase/isomerase family protein [Candidatus Lokiarchaeota archaeon]|nr:enoyl-CoA hydratase/isomerase family protein [Candidatus Lokiarchaeota archaeon]